MKGCIIMSNSDFLNRMRKAGEKYSGSGGAGIVGRILIEFGLHRYVTGHEFWSFWKPVIEENEMDIIAGELKARMQEAGNTDEPSFGVKITIKKDILSRTEPYKADLQEFIPAWQKDSFDLIYDAIEKSDLPVNEIFYGRIQYKANPFFVKKGEDGKTETDQHGVPRYPSIRLPVEKFSNEQTAKDAAGGSSSSVSTTSQWSEKAFKAYNLKGDMSSLESSTAQILKCLKDAGEGIAFNNDAETYELPVPPTPPNLKKYIADIYNIESSDIDLMIPF